MKTHLPQQAQYRYRDGGTSHREKWSERRQEEKFDDHPLIISVEATSSRPEVSVC